MIWLNKLCLGNQTERRTKEMSFPAPEVSLQGAAPPVRIFVVSHNIYHSHSAVSAATSSNSSSQATSYVYRKMDADFKCSINVTVEVAVQESDPSVSRGEKTCEMAGLHNSS